MPRKAVSRLANFRKMAGLSQAQLAVFVGVTTNTIQNWEKEDGLSQLEKYLKLATIFGCNVEDLLDFVENNKKQRQVNREFTLEDLNRVRESWGTNVRSYINELDNSNNLQNDEGGIK